jgi:hypothetical protein
LPSGQVDAGLAADRRVDHPEERRGDVDYRHATVPRRSGEPGDVGDHAPPTPITTSLRVSPIWAKPLVRSSIVASVLAPSPSPISSRSGRDRHLDGERLRSPATRSPHGARSRDHPGSADWRPWPTTTS